jgi:hypothetical protein
MKVKLYGLLILVSCLHLLGNAQQEKSTITINGFSYPDFGDGTVHKNFTLNYSLADNLDTELRWFYDHNGFSERLRVAILLKKYVSKKSYLLGGEQMEWEFLGSTLPSRVDVIMGAGHEFNKSILIEGILQVPVMNGSNVNPLGIGKTGNSFLNLSSKFKF